MNNKIDWKKKLTSRKLWVSVAGLASGLILALGGSNNTATEVTGVIMSIASVIAYTVGEGLVDAAAVKNKQNEENEKDEEE